VDKKSLPKNSKIKKNMIRICADVAQTVEHSLGKGKVSGSSPVIGFLENIGFLKNPFFRN